MSHEVAGKVIRRSGPFVKAGRRPDMLSKLAARAASQPPATTPAAIAAQAANPKSTAAKTCLAQSADL